MRKRPRAGPIIKALVCAMLEDNTRFLFLKRIDNHGVERLELPHVFVPSGKDSVSLLVSSFREQTGIDGQISDIIFEKKYNIGSRRKKIWIPCLAFKFIAKQATAKPSAEFSGFKWLRLEDAKKQKLARTLEWIR